MARKNSKVKNLGLRRYQHPDRFGEWLGYKIVSMSPRTRSAVLKITMREDHLSPSGRVHGGVISAFCDFACGAAVFSTLEKGQACSTVEMKVNYLVPIERGDELKAKTRVIFRGNRLRVVEGFIYKRGNQEPIAMVTATFNVVTRD